MARDKKRPKRGAPKPEDSESPRARDMNIDDASIDEAGITDSVAAPDPLKNSSADVDQAKAAETGATRGDSGEVEMGRDAREGEPDPEPGPPHDSIYDDEEGAGGEDFEHAPDELGELLGGLLEVAVHHAVVELVHRLEEGVTHGHGRQGQLGHHPILPRPRPHPPPDIGWGAGGA